MNELRACVVDGKTALFHMFEQYSEIVPPSIAIGGHSGGVLAGVFAIVEYEDGTVKKVPINSLRFVDKRTENVISHPKSQCYKLTKEFVRCKHCADRNNLNAVIWGDIDNKDYFVCCFSCDIETIETFKNKNTALKAFEDGKTYKINTDL